jgi:hypothetical protein
LGYIQFLFTTGTCRVQASSIGQVVCHKTKIFATPTNVAFGFYLFPINRANVCSIFYAVWFHVQSQFLRFRDSRWDNRVSNSQLSCRCYGGCCRGGRCHGLCYSWAGIARLAHSRIFLWAQLPEFRNVFLLAAFAAPLYGGLQRDDQHPKMVTFPTVYSGVETFSWSFKEQHLQRYLSPFRDSIRSSRENVLAHPAQINSILSSVVFMM